MKSDYQLHRDVLTELTWDPMVTEKEIGVAAKDGVVTLSGFVKTFAEQCAAELAAERVAGVKSVANELTVKIAKPFERTDTEIAHAVVHSLAYDVQLPPHKITSRVNNGWVTLEGQVGWQYQRDAAARAVRNLIGIRGVINEIHVVPEPVSTFDVSQTIKEALERRADNTAEKITVKASKGIVTLTGSVPSYGDRRAAEGAAWSAPGVTEVHDELAVVF
jgi:osmotically-inducible protein OsmY